MMHIKLEDHIYKMVPINLLTTTFQKIKIQIFSPYFNCAYFDEYEIGCSIVLKKKIKQCQIHVFIYFNSLYSFQNKS